MRKLFSKTLPVRGEVVEREPPALMSRHNCVFARHSPDRKLRMRRGMTRPSVSIGTAVRESPRGGVGAGAVGREECKKSKTSWARPRSFYRKRPADRSVTRRRDVAPALAFSMHFACSGTFP
ncbi:hypothetical protein EVAR_24834_1 [Eumeta japonica]|uniref:Uncharacterized protein n=1 Tax=Eumeta variegata TaxID=151549 RepID=A0A4C1W348_EUMVA|nr:hypothetical protein EVAR_24834_1 [Eumeta japonica]